MLVWFDGAKTSFEEPLYLHRKSESKGASESWQIDGIQAAHADRIGVVLSLENDAWSSLPTMKFVPDDALEWSFRVSHCC